jgi:hypothetical protein
MIKLNKVRSLLIIPLNSYHSGKPINYRKASGKPPNLGVGINTVVALATLKKSISNKIDIYRCHYTLSLYDLMLHTIFMSSKFKSNNNVTYFCKYHVVWCPKYRRKVLIHGVDARLIKII